MDGYSVNPEQLIKNFEWVALRSYSTVQKECKQISPTFGYCSLEISPKFQAKKFDFSAEISKKIR